MQSKTLKWSGIIDLRDLRVLRRLRLRRHVHVVLDPRARDPAQDVHPGQVAVEGQAGI